MLNSLTVGKLRPQWDDRAPSGAAQEPEPPDGTEGRLPPTPAEEPQTHPAGTNVNWDHRVGKEAAGSRREPATLSRGQAHRNTRTRAPGVNLPPDHKCCRPRYRPPGRMRQPLAPCHRPTDQSPEEDGDEMSLDGSKGLTL